MNTLNLSTLQAFQLFSLAYKIQFLETCPQKFIRFLSVCIVNLLQGDFPDVERGHVLTYRDKIQGLALKRTTWRQRRSLLSSQKGFLLIRTISPSSLNNCLEMEQFVLVPLSVFNGSNNPTLVIKQELPKKKPEQTPTNHKDMLKKEITKQLSRSGSPLINKILESPRITLRFWME